VTSTQSWKEKKKVKKNKGKHRQAGGNGHRRIDMEWRNGGWQVARGSLCPKKKREKTKKRKKVRGVHQERLL